MRLKPIPAVVVASILLVTALCQAEAPPDAFRQQFNLPRNPESVLNQVLSRDEFRDNAIGSLIDRVIARLKKLVLSALKWLVDRFPSLGPVKVRGDVFGTIGRALLIGVAILALLLLGLQVVKVIRARGRGQKVVGQSSTLDDEEPQTAARLRSSSLKEAGKGNFGLALVLMFRFVLVHLDEKGLLAYHPGKTNREILNGLKSSGPIRECLTDMIPMFNRVRYGKIPCNGDDYEKFVALAGRATEGI